MRTAPHITQVVPIDVATTRHALKQAGGCIADLVASIPDPAKPTRKLKWTLGETAAHVVQTIRLHAECVGGAVTPKQFDIATLGGFLADQNDQRITQLPERDSTRLAELIRDGLSDFETASAGRSETYGVSYPGGYTLEFALTCATLLAEILVHGYDIARSLRARWTISPDHARLAINSIPAMLPLGIDPVGSSTISGTAHVRIRGGECFSITIRSGAASSDRCEGRPDVRISAAPVPYLLASYGRISPVAPALAGQIISWGRKPFFPLQLQRAFRTP